MSSVFGDLVGGDDLEAAVEATMARWMATYLREIERKNQLDPHTIPDIAGKATLSAFAQPQDVQLPAYIIVSPGTSGEPERDGDRAYSFWYSVAVAVIVEARDDQAARKLAQMYETALAALFVQHPSLGNVAGDLYLTDRGHENAPPDFERGGCAIATVGLSVLLERVVTGLAGPSVPEDDPAPWPTVATVHIDAERLTS